MIRVRSLLILPRYEHVECDKEGTPGNESQKIKNTISRLREI